MSYTRLVWRNLFRHPLRTLFTTLSIALSIFLVCAVLTLPSTMERIVARVGSSVRVSVHHEAGLTYWLPFAYVHKVRAVPGVAAVNHFSWFGGIYDEPKNQFPNFGLDPDHVLDVWPDYNIDPRELERFRRIRNACLVGGATMRKFGWQVGQEITLRGTIFPVNLTLQIVGTIPENAGNPLVLWFNREYLEEAMEAQGGLRGVGMIWIRAESPEHVPGVMHAVNDLFRNSEAQVTAETEKSFFMSFFGSFRTLIRLIMAVGVLVVGAVVLIAANTSAMGIRERIPEIAVLKSLGFGRRPILLALLAESGSVALIGGLVGAGTAWGLFSALSRAGATGYSQLLGPLGQFQMTSAIFAQGVTVALVVGLVAGFVPAWNGARLRVVEALRRLF
jgi:putative ABC transport system permease protein